MDTDKSSGGSTASAGDVFLLEPWEREQDALRGQHVLHDDLDFVLIDTPASSPATAPSPVHVDEKAQAQAQAEAQAQAQTEAQAEARSLGGLERVGGVDISFVKGTHYACAALVVLSYPDLMMSGAVTVLYEDYEMVQLEHPYV